MSSNNANKKPALGKGLGALLSNASTDITSRGNAGKDVANAISFIAIEDIEVNPFNPRNRFEDSALEELKNSIQQHGIIQPLTVRKMGRGKYQIISGERRFRASQLAGLKEVPAFIRIANDQTMLEMALVENIQREDLNAIEVALSYQRLIEECALTQEQLSQKVAKSRASITNHLRLLKLPVEIQLGVIENKISMGHARALVSAGTEQEQLAVYAKILEENLTVRDVESVVKGNDDKGTVYTAVRQPKSNLSEREFVFKNHFADKLSSKVDIAKTSNGAGKIVINFSSESDLSRIIELLNG
ncbi:MAG TPA: ParB/RepB/Spo0J family partition protein [Crocinitomicaceae bacterium]|jgi:ParB family transcriptional regulator, chromosome partitioning protein|nr:ParB/RepB/Spo0J family partition protein [Crocinitomicaceae bacterium]